MFDSLVDLASSSAWTYALVFAMAALDVLAPIVPSESLLVAAAALSASGRLNVAVVALAGALCSATTSRSCAAGSSTPAFTGGCRRRRVGVSGCSGPSTS